MNRRMFSFLTKLKEYHKSILKIWGLRTNYCEMPLLGGHVYSMLAKPKKPQNTLETFHFYLLH